MPFLQMTGAGDPVTSVPTASYKTSVETNSKLAFVTSGSDGAEVEWQSVAVHSLQRQDRPGVSQGVHLKCLIFGIGGFIFAFITGFILMDSHLQQATHDRDHHHGWKITERDDPSPAITYPL